MYEVPGISAVNAFLLGIVFWKRCVLEAEIL